MKTHSLRKHALLLTSFAASYLTAGLVVAEVTVGGGGGIAIVEEGGTFAPNNLAVGQTAFALDVINNGGYAAHQTAHLSDGIYGNANSWIGNSADTYCGVSLGAAPVTIASVAFGRDNTGQYGDRWSGLYTLRYTQVANPDELTAVTGDAATGWQDIGTITYDGTPGTFFVTPAARHRFNFTAVSATGFRIDTAQPGTCIDEIELYEDQLPFDPPPAVALTPEAGFDITYDGNDADHFNTEAPPTGAIVPSNLALTGTAFGSGELGGSHLITNANDGFYGNSNSWIGAGGAGQFIGVSFGGLYSISDVAWGRDNGNTTTDPCDMGQCQDRSLGTYTVQITTDADPATTANWTTVGTVGFTAIEDAVPGGGFTPWFRHQFGISTEGGDPLDATGVRILVPNQDICIDELEVYADGAIPVLTPIEEAGATDAGNLAAAATAFAKDTLGGRSVGSLNDGVYGDASAWIGDTTNNFAGLALGSEMTVASIAFGRDNTGSLTDLTLGTYTLQYTTEAVVDASTPDINWTTIGEISLTGESPANPSLRHRFNFTAVMATGLRLLTPDGAAIDEFEAYAIAYMPPPPPAIVITPETGFEIGYDGNDGEFFDPSPAGAVPPDNLAMAANGATAFASSELGPELSISNHVAAKLNDGIYGNVSSWIGGDSDPGPQAFAGIAFPQLTSVASIAWGRDNGNGAIDDSDPGSDDCGGQCDDRALGIYTLQITTVPSPGAATPDGDWTTVGTIDYRYGRDDLVGEDFTEYIRHAFDLSQGGAPLLATGIRLLVPLTGIGGGTAIDELEVYGAVQTAPFEITSIEYNEATGAATMTFNSVPGGFYAFDTSIGLTNSGNFTPEDWFELGEIVGEGTTTTVCVIPPAGVSSCAPEYTMTISAVPTRFFRVRDLTN